MPQIKQIGGRWNNHWCVWVDWHGEQRVVFSNPDVRVAIRWVQKNIDPNY